MATIILRQEEGFSAHPYRDTIGLWTIGIGTLLEPEWARALDGIEADESLGVLRTESAICMDEAMAAALLALRIEALDDMLRVHSWYWRLASVECERGRERQALLLSMAYQLGVGGLLGFRRMLYALRDGDYGRASVDMLDSKWATQTPQRAERTADAMISGSLSAWGI